MKTKNFEEYLNKRLDKKEIAEIEKQADIELDAMKLLQEDISYAVLAHLAALFKRRSHITFD
jgi:hypothetical protein